MNKRITEAFAHGKAFIPFITCGDPSLEVTEQLVYALEEAGADLIELGIPFSDPTAEGPVIQAANVRALSGGVTTDKIFEMVEKIRKRTAIPMVFMTYANVVFSYGTERFVKKAADLGMDGLILPDVPFEEKEEFDSVCRAHGLDLISLIAPTSHERIARIAREAEGFVYCVSSLGVTGMRSSITTDIGAMVKLRSCRPFIAALPPIIANICIVPFVLRYAYGVALPIPIMMVTVGVGEVISCEVLGCILASVLDKYKLQIWKTAA